MKTRWLLCSVIALFSYASIVKGNNIEITNIRSITGKVLGNKTVGALTSKEEPEEALLSVEEKYGDERSFRVTFELPKISGGVEPETLELFVFNDKNEGYLKQSKSINGDEKGTKICNVIESNAREEYRCFIIDYPEKDVPDSFYQKFMVKVLDAQGHEIASFIGEKPKLRLLLEASKYSQKYDTLVVTNAHSREIEITAMGSGKNVMLMQDLRNVKIPANESHKVSISIKEGLLLGDDRKIEKIADIIPIEYRVDGADLDAKVVIVGDNIGKINRDKNLYERWWYDEVVRKEDTAKKYNEKESALLTREKNLEAELAEAKKHSDRYYLIAVCTGAVAIVTTTIALLKTCNCNFLLQRNYLVRKG